MKLHTRKGRRHGRPFQLNLQFLAEWTSAQGLYRVVSACIYLTIGSAA